MLSRRDLNELSEDATASDYGGYSSGEDIVTFNYNTKCTYRQTITDILTKNDVNYGSSAHTLVNEIQDWRNIYKCDDPLISQSPECIKLDALLELAQTPGYKVSLIIDAMAKLFVTLNPKEVAHIATMLKDYSTQKSDMPVAQANGKVHWNAVYAMGTLFTIMFSAVLIYIYIMNQEKSGDQCEIIDITMWQYLGSFIPKASTDHDIHSPHVFYQKRTVAQRTLLQNATMCIVKSLVSNFFSYVSIEGYCF